MARLKLTIVMKSGARIGPGKITLLESIKATGSISAAARSMDMDYKRAWTLIDSLNKAFEEPSVTRSAGGAGGGGATLTEFGETLLASYRRMETLQNRKADTELSALEQKAAPDTGPKV